MAPTYRLLWGIPGRSNAIAIARRLGLQTDVLDDAVEALGSGEADVTQVHIYIYTDIDNWIDR